MFVELALWNVVPFLGDIHLLDTNLQSHLQYFCIQSEVFLFLQLLYDFQNKKVFSRNGHSPWK